ncbi:predicted protein [Sclerotinia sclerotiorum 1980 UF-70]|uniref:Uncharacterized protein n=1 Tax=Sclerotinia sclerotiorum (strain ATCC 18683 / 1980 / Ss-1) TaxID=665079 RepID=A7E7Q0_SCLS1|nr:predicted protein [Sclerotinia sclerotiorum 1980 UF-70]EDN96402.1 predicted protein [Sclerotinia sclerotiorum 1980 UF-70]
MYRSEASSFKLGEILNIVWRMISPAHERWRRFQTIYLCVLDILLWAVIQRAQVG